MANKTLTAKVSINTTNATRSLDKLIKKINMVNNFINKNTNTKGLDKQLEKALLQQEKLKQATLKTQLAESKVTAQNHRSNKAKSDALIAEERLTQAKHKTALAELRVKTATDTAKHSTNALLTTVGKLAKTYLGIQTVKLGITASDTVTSAQNRLNNLEGGNPEQTAEAMDKIYTASQRARTGYDDMLNSVSKTMTLAPDAFQGNIDNAIRFQEIMAKSYTVGGASAQEMSTSMYQLTQALGSGILAGDELRSVREGAPIAYKEIEKFAQGVYNTTDSLKDMASEGKITSDMVVAAIMNAGDKIEEKFNNTKITFAQAWTQIKNTAMKAFQPALESLNKMLNSDAGRAIVEGLGTAMIVVGNILSWVMNLFSKLLDFIYSIITGSTTAGKIIRNILLTIGITMAIVLLPKFIAWIGYLLWVVYYYTYLGAIALASGIKAMIGWMMANWVLLLIIIVIAAVVAAVIWLSDSFSDACGMIVGGIMAAIAFVWNAFVGVINAIIQFLWTKFVEPWIGIIEWVLNVFNGGFDSFGDAVKNLLGNIISWFLSLGKVVTKIIDAIFGTNWTDGLSSLQDKVLSWGKNDKAITLSREAPSLKDIGVDRWAYSDAYNTGYKWGESAGNWVTDKVNNIGNMLKGEGLPDPNDPNFNVSNAYAQPTLEELKDINGNTKESADSLKLADEDLEWMRRVADMEWRNEFTTAEIKVDMTNNNTVNNEQDMDGMISYLSDKLREEMHNVAHGVHY